MGRVLPALIILILIISCSGAFNSVPVTEGGTVRAVTITDTKASLTIRLRTWGDWTMEAERGSVTLNPGEIYTLQPGGEFKLLSDMAGIVFGDYLIFNETWLSPLDRQNLQLWYESEWDSWLTIEL